MKTANLYTADIPIFAVGGKKILSEYNYANSDKARKSAIKTSIAKTNFKTVYNELYLTLRNLPDSEYKSVLQKDIMYLKKKYYAQKGGTCTDNSDTKFELIDLPEKIVIEQKYEVNGKSIMFRTLNESDSTQIHELDLKYLDSDQLLNQAKEKIVSNPGLLIGIFSDNELQGYCLYKPNDKIIKLDWFCANKSFGTPLFQFLEKYFITNKYIEIDIIVSLEGSYATRRLNFWNRMGFVTNTIGDKKLFMSKKLIK